MELEAFLSERLGAPVDLVTPDAIKPMMRERDAPRDSLCLNPIPPSIVMTSSKPSTA
jgi:hypothetical protein